MAKEIFVPRVIVGTVVPTMIVGTAVPTRVVGTTAREMIVPTMIVRTIVPTIIVGTAVPTIIVLTAYYWKSRVQDIGEMEGKKKDGKEVIKLFMDLEDLEEEAKDGNHDHGGH